MLRARLQAALTQIRDCEWILALPPSVDRISAIRQIAAKALRGEE